MEIMLESFYELIPMSKVSSLPLFFMTDTHVFHLPYIDIMGLCTFITFPQPQCDCKSNRHANKCCWVT